MFADDNENEVELSLGIGNALLRSGPRSWRHEMEVQN